MSNIVKWRERVSLSLNQLHRPGLDSACSLLIHHGYSGDRAIVAIHMFFPIFDRLSNA